MTGGESNVIIVGDFRFLNAHEIQVVGAAISAELFCLLFRRKTLNVPCSKGE